jgi:hypothetical protein
MSSTLALLPRNRNPLEGLPSRRPPTSVGENAVFVRRAQDAVIQVREAVDFEKIDFVLSLERSNIAPEWCASAAPEKAAAAIVAAAIIDLHIDGSLQKRAWRVADDLMLVALAARS